METKCIGEPELANKNHQRSQSTANSVARVISNMKVPNPFKKMVSQRRRRYRQDGFDLDLTYIFDNLIAMGYPAEKLEGVYRNHIDDVARFLDEKHKNHYKIYNLCAERTYDINKFHQRVAYYPFDDHNPPCMEVIRPFCEDVDNWLSKNEKNVAVVHCKAGKGRTGVMVSCYMLHSRLSQTAEEALSHYGDKRTTDRKGVTIPSQCRYVNYYASLVREKLLYFPVKLYVREVCFEPVPLIFSTTQGSVQFVISECKRVGEFALKVKKLYTSVEYDIRRGSTSFRETLLTDVAVQGDVKVEVFKHHKKEKLFHFWFNTFFVKDIMAASAFDSKLTADQKKPRVHSVGEVESKSRLKILRMSKAEIDDAHKDKQNKIFSDDFKVTVVMEECDGNIQPGIEPDANTPSESSEAESSTESSVAADEEEAWESVGENVELVGVKLYRRRREDTNSDVIDLPIRL